MTIDFHMIHFNESNEWVDKHKQTIEDYGHNCYIVAGEEGSTFRPRINGFSSGESEYVSFVDPDDLIDLTQLPPYQDHQACYTNSIRQVNHTGHIMYDMKEWSWDWHIQHRLPVHQLIVVERDIMDQALYYASRSDIIKQAPMHVEQVIFGYVASLAPWVFYPDLFPYMWLQRDGHLHRQSSKQVREQVRRHIATLTPVWR